MPAILYNYIQRVRCLTYLDRHCKLVVGHVPSVSETSILGPYIEELIEAAGGPVVHTLVLSLPGCRHTSLFVNKNLGNASLLNTTQLLYHILIAIIPINKQMITQ